MPKELEEGIAAGDDVVGRWQSFGRGCRQFGPNGTDIAEVLGRRARCLSYFLKVLGQVARLAMGKLGQTEVESVVDDVKRDADAEEFERSVDTGALGGLHNGGAFDVELASQIAAKALN